MKPPWTRSTLESTRGKRWNGSRRRLRPTCSGCTKPEKILFQNTHGIFSEELLGQGMIADQIVTGVSALLI